MSSDPHWCPPGTIAEDGILVGHLALALGSLVNIRDRRPDTVQCAADSPSDTDQPGCHMLEHLLLRAAADDLSEDSACTRWEREVTAVSTRITTSREQVMDLVERVEIARDHFPTLTPCDSP